MNGKKVSSVNGKKVSNPLTLMAVFAGLSESISVGVLPLLQEGVQRVFVWFVMLFPSVLLLAFFVTLNFNHVVLYAPGDYQDESNFFKVSSSKYASPTTAVKTLRIGQGNTVA